MEILENGGQRGLFLALSGIHGVHPYIKHCIEELEKFFDAQEMRVVIQKSYDFGRISLAGAEDVGGNRFGDSPEADFLQECAGRAKLSKNVIAPALKRGEVILCEFFDLDSHVNLKKNFKNEEIPFLLEVENFARGGIEPDWTFFIDIPVTVSLMTLELPFEALPEYEKMREEYISEIAKNGKITIIDGDHTKEEIYADVLAEVKKMI